MADEERLERLRALKERIAREQRPPAANPARSPEVELPYEQSEFEIMPVTPIRRLERKVEELEKTRTMGNLERFVDKVIDMVELNQKIVEEMVKANHGLREDVAVLIGKLDELYTRIGEFVDVIKSAGEVAGTEEAAKGVIAEAMGPIVSKLDEMTRRTAESSGAVVDTLTSIDKRLRAMQLTTARPVVRRPFGGAPLPPLPEEGAGGP